MVEEIFFLDGNLVDDLFVQFSLFFLRARCFSFVFLLKLAFALGFKLGGILFVVCGNRVISKLCGIAETKTYPTARASSSRVHSTLRPRRPC